MTKKEKKYPIDRIIYPIEKFIHQEKAGGIVLIGSVILAVFLANSQWSEQYFHFFEHSFGFRFDEKNYFEFSLHHWINDGLMAIFFFVVGLELKREIVGGELSNPRQALLPIGAAMGGILFPALIYVWFNPIGEVRNGWGIPMATDIAFALGVLYLFGSKIPLSLKVFLTALAIVDDLGAVLVIAFFYTSDISSINLLIGLGFILFMFAGNIIGIRNVFFYAILGILGVWVAFLLSGVHATIASVLAAFTIPAQVRIREDAYVSQIIENLKKFKKIDPQDEIQMLTQDQLYIIDNVKKITNKAIPPLQQLENAMHPFVIFIIIPIFALANAGVSLDFNMQQLLSSNVFFGVSFGLLLGKVVGVVSFTWLLVKFKVAVYPPGMNFKNLIGIGFLASIGFTMSLFITSLAFQNPEYITQAKIGIFLASIVGGCIGYAVLKSQYLKK